jgi:hypothetical protein
MFTGRCDGRERGSKGAREQDLCDGKGKWNPTTQIQEKWRQRKVITPQIGRKKFRKKSGKDYFDLDSSVTSVEQFAATMAGAMTIPIKARAIKKSCMISVSSRR